MGSDDPNGDKPLEDQLEDLGKDVENYASFHRTETGGKATKMLGATLNIGADYAFPLYDKLHFGFLSSTRINGPYSWSEGRLSANVSPVKWFDAGVNYGLSTFGSSFGWDSELPSLWIQLLRRYGSYTDKSDSAVYSGRKCQYQCKLRFQHYVWKA